MKYLLLNDTRQTANVGCKATVSQLCSLYATKGYDLVDSVPVGTGSEYFSNVIQPAPANQNGIISFFKDQVTQHFPTAYHHAAWNFPSFRVNYRAWCGTLDKLEAQFEERFGNVDTVVVNAEGSLHHNFPNGMAICALIAVARKAGCRIHIVNGSVQWMDERVLRDAFEDVDRLVVREPISQKWLKSVGYTAQLAPDCLFLATPPANRSNTGHGTCLYTPGVLSTLGKLQSNEVVEHLSCLSASFDEVVFLSIDKEDQQFEQAAHNTGCEVVSWEDLVVDTFLNWISRFNLVISGRYHVLIFSWISGVPTVAMQSNTWKIEGLLQLGQVPEKPVRTLKDLETTLEKNLTVLPNTNTLKSLHSEAALNGPPSRTENELSPSRSYE